METRQAHTLQLHEAWSGRSPSRQRTPHICQDRAQGFLDSDSSNLSLHMSERRTALRSRSALRSLSSFSLVMTTLEGSRPTFTVAPFTCGGPGGLRKSVRVTGDGTSKDLATACFLQYRRYSTVKPAGRAALEDVRRLPSQVAPGSCHRAAMHCREKNGAVNTEQGGTFSRVMRSMWITHLRRYTATTLPSRPFGRTRDM